MPLPSDILAEINRQFPAKTERQQAQKLLDICWQRPLNVGPAQLARCLLLLGAGQLPAIRAVIEADFYGDPRDILLAANDRWPGCHYGLNPFVETAKIALQKDEYHLLTAPAVFLPSLQTSAELWVDSERTNQTTFSKHQMLAFESFLAVNATEIAAMYRAVAAEGQRMQAEGRITKASLNRRPALPLKFRAAVLPRQDKTDYQYVLLLADTPWKIKHSSYFIELEILFENNKFQLLQEYSGLWTRPDWDYAYNVPLAQYRAARDL
ncbi:MAG: hypothetical protein ACRYFX_16585 [Janthinobacterium lividum]